MVLGMNTIAFADDVAEVAATEETAEVASANGPLDHFDSTTGFGFDKCVLRPLPDKNAATSGRGADSHRTSSGDHRTLQDGRYWLQCNESWPAIALQQLAMSILGVISLPSDLS